MKPKQNNSMETHIKQSKKLLNNEQQLSDFKREISRVSVVFKYYIKLIKEQLMNPINSEHQKFLNLNGFSINQIKHIYTCLDIEIPSNISSKNLICYLKNDDVFNVVDEKVIDKNHIINLYEHYIRTATKNYLTNVVNYIRNYINKLNDIDTVYVRLHDLLFINKPNQIKTKINELIIESFMYVLHNENGFRMFNIKDEHKFLVICRNNINTKLTENEPNKSDKSSCIFSSMFMFINEFFDYNSVGEINTNYDVEFDSNKGEIIIQKSDEPNIPTSELLMKNTIETYMILNILRSLKDSDILSLSGMSNEQLYILKTLIKIENADKQNPLQIPDLTTEMFVHKFDDLYVICEAKTAPFMYERKHFSLINLSIRLAEVCIQNNI